LAHLTIINSFCQIRKNLKKFYFIVSYKQHHDVQIFQR